MHPVPRHFRLIPCYQKDPVPHPAQSAQLVLPVLVGLCRQQHRRRPFLPVNLLRQSPHSDRYIQPVRDFQRSQKNQ